MELRIAEEKSVKTNENSSGSSLLTVEANSVDWTNFTETWFVDNGATRHLTFRKDFLKDYQEFITGEFMVNHGNSMLQMEVSWMLLEKAK